MRYDCIKGSEATTKLDQDFYDYRTCGPLTSFVWKDKKVIIFLSTVHVTTGNLSVSRTARDESMVQVNCPPCLPDFQEFMGGVDLSDQRMSYYYIM